MQNQKTINFSAVDERLSSGCPGGYPSDSVAWIRAVFDLGTGWGDFQSVRAVWQNGVAVVSTVLDASGACTVPWEVLQYRGTVMVNLVGSDTEGDELVDRLTTFRIPAVVIKDKANVSGSETTPVTPSQFEQFVSIVTEEAEAAEEAQRVTEAARDEAVASAEAAALSEQNASDSASAAAESERNAAASETAAEGYMERAETAAENAEQSAAQSGYMRFEIREDGCLYMDRVNSPVTFYLQNGYLFVEEVV